MISIILLFPILCCFILFLLRKKNIGSFLILLSALVHFAITMCLFFDKNILQDINNKFFIVDDTNKIFLLVLSIVYLAFAFYNLGYMRFDYSQPQKLTKYAGAVLLFITSMTGAILSADLALNWVFLEATTLASVYLIYFHKTKHSIEAAWKYVFICSIGIALAFVGIILLTAATGNLSSLNYQDLYNNAASFNPFWLKLSFVFILFGIGTKMGLAPVHFWLPDAHAQSPSPISALLSAALLNSAFLMILNVFKVMAISGQDSYSRLLLLSMGFLSLFVAAVFLYHIKNYKRMLAYSSIENMGILAIGTALGGYAMFAALIHLIGHSFIKASFFMTSGNILKLYETKNIDSIKGLLNTDNKTGWLWMLSFLGIAAFPPSVLFISEFLIIKTMFQQGHYLLSCIFMLLLTIILFGLGRAVISMCYGNTSNNTKEIKLPSLMYVPQLLLLILSFIMGLFLPLSKIIFNVSVGF